MVQRLNEYYESQKQEDVSISSEENVSVKSEDIDDKSQAKQTEDDGEDSLTEISDEDSNQMPKEEEVGVPLNSLESKSEVETVSFF